MNLRQTNVGWKLFKFHILANGDLFLSTRHFRKLIEIFINALLRKCSLISAPFLTLLLAGYSIPLISFLKNVSKYKFSIINFWTKFEGVSDKL